MIVAPDAVEKPSPSGQHSPAPLLKQPGWLGRWRAPKQWPTPALPKLRRPGTWLGRWWPTLLVGSLALALLAALYSTGTDTATSTIQLTARADSVVLETVSEMWMGGLWASDVRVSGAKALYLPAKENPVQIARDQSITILESSPTLVHPRPTRVELHLPPQRLIRLARLLDDRSTDRYSIQAKGPESEIVVMLQPGHTIVSRGERIENLYTERGVGSQVLLMSEADGPFQLDLTVDRSHSGRILPTRIRGLGFVVSAFPGDARAFASGIVSGELGFLEVPEKQVALRQGADLRLSALDATLQSLSFREGHLDLNVTGEVSSANLWIGGASRSVQPTLFEFYRNHNGVRVVIGIWGLLCVALAVWEVWLKWKGR